MNDISDDDSRTALAAEAASPSTASVPRDGIPAGEDVGLRHKAREALRSGRLPSGKPESVWGGPGSGVTCAVCGQHVGGNQLGFELEFARGGESFIRHVHIPCFAAWEFECQSELQGFGDDGTILDRDRQSNRRGNR